MNGPGHSDISIPIETNANNQWIDQKILVNRTWASSQYKERLSKYDISIIETGLSL